MSRFYKVVWDSITWASIVLYGIGKRLYGIMYIGFCRDYRGLCREYTREGYVMIL